MNIQSTNFGQALQQMQKPAPKTPSTATFTESQDTFSSSVKFGSKDKPGFIRRTFRLGKGKTNEVMENLEEGQLEAQVKLEVREQRQKLDAALEQAEIQKNKALAKETLQKEKVSKLEKELKDSDAELDALIDYMDKLEHGSEEEVLQALRLYGKTLADRQKEFEDTTLATTEKQTALDSLKKRVNDEQEVLSQFKNASSMARAEFKKAEDNIAKQHVELDEMRDLVEQTKGLEDLAEVQKAIKAITGEGIASSETARLFKKAKERHAEAQTSVQENSQGEKVRRHVEASEKAELSQGLTALEKRREQRRKEREAQESEQAEQKADAVGGSKKADPFDE